MPVGPYATFGECVASQRRRGRSEESARRICGEIESEQEQQMSKDRLGAVRELFSGILKMLGADPVANSPAILQPDEGYLQIRKFNDDEQLVFGWASVSMRVDGELIIDRQGDIIEPEVLEKAAYEFMLNFRGSGVNHEGAAKGQIVESVVFTPDKLAAMGLEKDALPLGWWIGVKIEDPAVFKRVKAGELPMFSIQGSAEREEAA